KRVRLRQGSDELVFGAVAGRHGSASEGVRQRCGTLAQRQAGCPPRTLLWSAAADSRPRTLSRYFVPQAGGNGRFQALAADARSRPVAEKFRSNLAGAHRPPWKAKRHETNDRVAQSGAETRSAEAASGD